MTQHNILIPTVTEAQYSCLIEVYSSTAGPLTQEHVKLLEKNITSLVLGLFPSGLYTTGQDVADRVRLFLKAQHQNADWIDEQRLYSIGRCKGDSIKLGLAIALLLHDQHNAELDIIATGNLGGHKGVIKILPVAKVAEKFQLVLKERQANKLDAKKIVFFTPENYLDDNGNEQSVNDLQDEIDQLTSVGIEVKPISHLIDIFEHLNIAIPNYSKTAIPPLTSDTQDLTAPRRLNAPQKIILALSAILFFIIACQIQIPQHHKMGEFEQITHYTLLDKIKQLGEKIMSYRYQKPLSVMVVYSEKAPYEVAIVNSFLEHLGNQIQNLEPATYPEPLYNPDGTQKNVTEWAKSIEHIIERTPSRKVDYFITLGTFVTKAIRDNNFIEKYKAKGVVFLGVTDPVNSKLVDKLENLGKDIEIKDVNKNITGVRYGAAGEEDYGNTIGSIFPPDQKLVFVFDEVTYPQDGFVADHLKKLINKDKRFELREKDSKKYGLINLNDLNPKQPNDPPEVYFAWYGLDNILRDNVKGDGLAALNTKWVIPSTYSTDNLDRAGIIVSVSDQEVGRLGAEIIFKSYRNPKLELGHEPVATTPFLIWLDCEVIRHRKEGLRLATPLPNATEIRNKDACPSVMQ